MANDDFLLYDNSVDNILGLRNNTTVDRMDDLLWNFDYTNFAINDDADSKLFDTPSYNISTEVGSLPPNFWIQAILIKTEPIRSHQQMGLRHADFPLQPRHGLISLLDPQLQPAKQSKQQQKHQPSLRGACYSHQTKKKTKSRRQQSGTQQSRETLSIKYQRQICCP
jgi:hypothetical protein